MEIKIGNKIIGEIHPCFIIAEAGVNHDGDITKAKTLIDIAKNAGVDAVKFQTWITEEISTENVEQAEYQIRNIGKKETQFDMLKRLELTFDEFIELKNYADEKQIIFLSTPDDEKSVDFLDGLDVPAFKIGSGELTNIFMIEKIAKTNKPIILSTGMADLKEIEEAIKIIYKYKNKKLILLHCTSQYPTKYQDVNLKAMVTLKDKFKTLVGYSDHTLGIIVPLIAVSLGACVIEKHFTYNKNAEGPDHKCSLDQVELKEMIEKIRTVELVLGNEVKEPILKELELRNLIRKTIVAKIDIPKGSKITRNMLSLKRSGGDLQPNEVKKLIGKITKINIKKDQPIKLKDFKN